MANARSLWNVLSNTQALMRAIETCRRRDELDDVLHVATAAFGVSRHLIGIVPSQPIPPAEQAGHVLAGAWPEEWARRYFARQYVEDDPTIAHARGENEPLWWGDVRATARAGLIMDEAKSFGLQEGTTIPQITLDGLRLGVSFSGERIDDSPQARTALLFIASAGASRAISLAQPPSPAVPRLTNRERECLLWLIDGKSDWEISVILGISRRLVERYMHSIRTKLGVSTRVQTVVAAFRLGLVS